MPDDRRKMYSKKGTGTVPKIKHRNNTSRLNQDDHKVVSNNLGRDCNQPNLLILPGNSGRNLSSSHYFTMESLINEQNSLPIQNGVLSTNGSVSTTNTSESVSRRNSIGTVPKCDNVTKYPDKKQIEDKLKQIREYLHITSSLMSNMKNAEDQSTDPTENENLEKTYSDLKDSEAKLVAMLCDIDDYDKCLLEDSENQEIAENGLTSMSEQRAMKYPKNVLEKKVEDANRQIEMLREQENQLLNLQLKAENQLREARHAQQKLIVHQNTNVRNMEESFAEAYGNGYADVVDVISNASSKNLNENNDFIKELEDSLKSLKSDLAPLPSESTVPSVQEYFLYKVDSLQQKINQLRDSNDNRNQIIHILDNRDAQLQTQHMELQGKLIELQNRKKQVDLLTSQLHNLNDDVDEDIGSQVKKIVTMKQQLSQLKDKLEVAKTVESAFESQNVNESDAEIVETGNTVTTKTDNLIQNDVRGNRLVSCSEFLAIARPESTPTNPSNERRVKEKQVNKKSMNTNERERMMLQAQLQAKKRELEELMCKHKAASSNLNQDVHCENKSDIGAASSSLYEGTNSWYPMPSNLYHLPNSSERYSSDDCPEDDMNEFSELNSSGEASNVHMVHPMPSLNYPTSNYLKHKEGESRLEVPPETFACGTAHTPDQSVRSASVGTSTYQRERGRSNSEQDTQNKSQVQKQLELIRSVCDSMLEQQTANVTSQTATQNVRNNLTPSPLYSEPRQFDSPNPHTNNALNVVNPTPDTTWLPPNFNQQHFPLNETTNYQNWLATNTLQTQAFMLNTLNQCCQMLWLQQRELTSLRNVVSTIQDRVQSTPFEQSNTISSYMHTTPCLYPTVPPSDSRRNSQIRTPNNPKVNQVSSAASLPNLNHPHVSQTNTEPAYANQNNLHNARVLESGLNNSVHSHPNTVGDHVNNSVLHGVNHSLPSQLWNGQALNNQVAPGNRANNYWDNFRSYSRQNLLSTKNNEGLHNQPATVPERPNNSIDRPQTFSCPPVTEQKRNSAHPDSVSSSVENTPRRRPIYKSPRHSSNTPNVATVPPDVLNINEASSSTPKMNESNDLLEIPLPMLNQSGFNNDEVNFQPFLSMFTPNEPSTSHPKPTDSHTCKVCPSRSHRNRNEWNNDTPSDSTLPKSKLFDELRENVYKEVASLISANQGRPHFLIQLFRDLQLVSSDPMRRRTLQSIQSLISNSLTHPGCNPQGTIRQNSSVQSIGVDNDVLTQSPTYLGSFWEHPRSMNIEGENNVDSDCQEHLSEVLIFLNTHNDEFFEQDLLNSLKELLVESTFSSLFINTTSKDIAILKHFANLVAEALDQYRGKRVQDITMNILQTIEDLLSGEISLIRLMRENIVDNCDLIPLINNEASPAQSNPFDLQGQFPNSGVAVDDNSNPPQIQNGDLAEADQSRLEIEDDEEGAVGGALNLSVEQITDVEMPNIDYAVTTEPEFTEQGLDQVPTRLTTHSRSHSNTPNRDRSSSSRTDTFEQF